MEKQIIERYMLIVKNRHVEGVLEKIGDLIEDGYYLVSRHAVMVRGTKSRCPSFNEQRIIFERIIKDGEDIEEKFSELMEMEAGG